MASLPISGRPEAPSFYEAVGGEPTFRRIVARFYAEVAKDATLRALYPEADLGPAEERLRLFLIQYWGGPQTYTEQRGHPRLRMRHAPFRVGPTARDAWMRAMAIALDEASLPAAAREQLMSYFASTAQHMVNGPD